MPEKPVEPSGSERPGDDAPAADGADAERTERLGPLTVARHVKDDGRALILFTRDEPGQQ
jgi:hypothetical protein